MCCHGSGVVCQREEEREWLIRESSKVEFGEDRTGREIQCEEQLAANTSGERRWGSAGSSFPLKSLLILQFIPTVFYKGEHRKPSL